MTTAQGTITQEGLQSLSQPAFLEVLKLVGAETERRRNECFSFLNQLGVIVPIEAKSGEYPVPFTEPYLLVVDRIPGGIALEGLHCHYEIPRFPLGCVVELEHPTEKGVSCAYIHIVCTREDLENKHLAKPPIRKGKKNECSRMRLAKNMVSKQVLMEVGVGKHDSPAVKQALYAEVQ